MAILFFLAGLLLVVFVGFVIALSEMRSFILAICGIAIVFLALPLAIFFAFLTTSYASKETIDAWLFSFRFLGIALFVWGMFDGICQRIENAIQSSNLNQSHKK